jgi:hypothetical protein
MADAAGIATVLAADGRDFLLRNSADQVLFAPCTLSLSLSLSVFGPTVYGFAS